MKTKIFWVILSSVTFLSCEQKLDLCIERTPIPVIYSVFNKYDSVNYLYVTKTWSGDNGGSLATARNPDSIYFKNVTVRMDLIRNYDSVLQTGPDTLQVVPDFEWIHDKKPGYFIYPDCPVFALRRHLEEFNELISHISIPGYDPIVIHYRLKEKPIFTSPYREGAAVTLLPKKDWKISFNGFGLVELNLSFQILTKSGTGIISDTVKIKKYTGGSPTKITYGNLLSALNLQLKNRSGLEYRQFGKIDMEIWVGDGSFPGYNTGDIPFSYIDFTLPGSSWVPKQMIYGGTIAMNQLHNIVLDDVTREALASDTSLTKFKFVKW